MVLKLLPLDAGALPWPGGSKPIFSGQEPWPQTWRCWLLSFYHPVLPDGLPEFPELHQDPNICSGIYLLPSQPDSIELLLQLDSIPYLQCPPLGLGIATMTGTRNVTATVMTGSGKHGPLRLNVSCLPRELNKTPPEVEVEDHPDRNYDCSHNLH